jgi:replicative DNA helicase
MPSSRLWADEQPVRTPPENMRAEQALLGAILANNKAFDAVSHFLRAEHFFDPVNATVFTAIACRIEAGRLADAVSLKSDLENAGSLEAVGGTAYLTSLLSAMVGIVGVREYGLAIQDSWHRRKLIEVGQTLTSDAFGAGDGRPATEAHEAAEAALYDLAERGEIDEAHAPAHEAMAQAIDAAAKASEQPTGPIGLTTGFAELDEITGGWRRGHLALLAARPSMGKTTLALSMAAGAAELGAAVLFASMEMSRAAIGGVLAAGLAQLPRDAGDRGRIREPDSSGGFAWRSVTQQEIDRMIAAQRAMVNQRLIIDECRSHTMAAIRAQARRMKRRGGLDLVVIDYLGLMRVPELARIGNRVLEVSHLSAQAKALAIEMDVPVLMLCQLNRGPEGPDDKRPTTADLRDSGSLEQDADLLMFIYREHY